MSDNFDYHAIDESIKQLDHHPDKLLLVLREIQDRYRFLPRELLIYAAEKCGCTEARAYHTATFYREFSFEPKGKYLIKVCDGTGCHFHHGPALTQVLWKELGLNHKKNTTGDGLFTVETVSCLGVCALAPTVMVNDTLYPSMTGEKLLQLIAEYRSRN